MIRVPGPVNAHSHAFHRILRGRTHGTGTFWTWREQMYTAAGRLDPESYERLATAVYAEMVVAGWTAVGEFHYLHHGPGGTAYPDHEMERALARAAQAAGIRLVLLDTCYLTGGLENEALRAEQQRFSDGDARRWAVRHQNLRETFAGVELVTVGAAIHSVRAVAADAFATVVGALAEHEPLHVHLSEQPAENDACLAAYGCTPTELLARYGVLDRRLSAVHATHLTGADIAALGRAECSIVMCPTTEADLADGIGPARELADAGATIALGTDQHAVVDPYLEMRALEHGERLATGVRGRFGPADLLAAARAGGLRSLGLPDNDDHLLVDAASVRTAGSRADQIPLTATAADVRSVTINGVQVARDGIHTHLGDPAELLREVLTDREER